MPRNRPTNCVGRAGPAACRGSSRCGQAVAVGRRARTAATRADLRGLEPAERAARRASRVAGASHDQPRERRSTNELSRPNAPRRRIRNPANSEPTQPHVTPRKTVPAPPPKRSSRARDDELADTLAAQPPEVLELLERIDDLVFTAISGDDRALAELEVLWPTVVARARRGSGRAVARAVPALCAIDLQRSASKARAPPRARRGGDRRAVRAVRRVTLGRARAIAVATAADHLPERRRTDSRCRAGRPRLRDDTARCRPAARGAGRLRSC